MRLVGRVRVRGVGYRARFASLRQCYIFNQIYKRIVWVYPTEPTHKRSAFGTSYSKLASFADVN